ncbi:MAG: HAD-IA family hydrolase, partial [Rhodospirillales bacterium]
MNRLALFDCDGTLVDSQYSIVASMHQAFAEQALQPPDATAVRAIVGLRLDEAIRRLAPALPAERIGALCESYRQAFVAIHQDPDLKDALYDGVPEMLAQFEQLGWVLGIATGKSRSGLRDVLDRFGLGDRFVTLKTADDGPGKPDPSIVRDAMAEAGSGAQTSVVIGDTSFDMLMARN